MFCLEEAPFAKSSCPNSQSQNKLLVADGELHPFCYVALTILANPCSLMKLGASVEEPTTRSPAWRVVPGETRPSWLWWLFSATVFGLFVLAVQQLAARIRFPWDLFIWAES